MNARNLSVLMSYPPWIFLAGLVLRLLRFPRSFAWATSFRERLSLFSLFDTKLTSRTIQYSWILHCVPVALCGSRVERSHGIAFCVMRVTFCRLGRFSVAATGLDRPRSAILIITHGSNGAVSKRAPFRGGKTLHMSSFFSRLARVARTLRRTRT